MIGKDGYMDELIKLLNPSYELISSNIKKKLIVLSIRSTIESKKCPYCGKKTKRVHSTYQREIQDLPIQEKQVILLVDTRKMFCDNQECTHKTFSESHPFVAYKGRKTERLIKNILYTSAQLSSVNASKLLKSDHIIAGKSSICNLLKKNAIHCG